MRRDQYPWIRPEPCHRHVLEFTDINIESCAAQVIVLERLGEGPLVDDLAPGDVDDHAPRLHRGKAIRVEEAGCLRRQLAADHYEIAIRQEAIEIVRAAKLAESEWQRPVRLGVSAGAEDPHPEGRAKFADGEPDSAGAHDARGLTFQKQRSICAMVEHASAPV